MSSANRSLAHRYAYALFLSSKEINMLDQVEKELKLVVGIIGENPELHNIVELQAISQEVKKTVFEKLFANKISSCTMNFVKLVIDKHRERYFQDILDEFSLLADEARGVVEVEIISAFELLPEQEEMVKERLDAGIGKEVRLMVKVDPNLLGGMIVKIDDKVFDGSAKQQLRAMRRRLETVHFEGDRGEQAI